MVTRMWTIPITGRKNNNTINNNKRARCPTSRGPTQSIYKGNRHGRGGAPGGICTRGIVRRRGRKRVDLLGPQTDPLPAPFLRWKWLLHCGMNAWPILTRMSSRAHLTWFINPPPQRKSECELLNVCSLPTAMEVRLKDTRPSLESSSKRQLSARGLLYTVLHVVYLRRKFVVISTSFWNVFIVQIFFLCSLSGVYWML